MGVGVGNHDSCSISPVRSAEGSLVYLLIRALVRILIGTSKHGHDDRAKDVGILVLRHYHRQRPHRALGLAPPLAAGGSRSSSTRATSGGATCSGGSSTNATGQRRDRIGVSDLHGSRYSDVGCTSCGAFWQTSAAYVESLADGDMDDVNAASR